MYQSTVSNPIGADVLPDYLVGLSDSRWFQEMTRLIVADLPLLSEDDHQIVCEHMTELRLLAHERAVAA